MWFLIINLSLGVVADGCGGDEHINDYVPEI